MYQSLESKPGCKLNASKSNVPTFVQQGLGTYLPRMKVILMGTSTADFGPRARIA